MDYEQIEKGTYERIWGSLKGRFSKKEFKQFLYIARGSLYETVTMLQIFTKKNWLNEESYGKLYSEAEEINKMLSGLINSIKASL